MRRPAPRRIPVASALVPLAATAVAACAPRALTRPALATDRPGYSDGTAVVPRGAPVLEAGYTYTGAEGVQGHALGEVLLRGAAGPLSDHLEWRLQLNSYGVVRTAGAPGGAATRVAGPEDIAIGAKVRVHARGDAARGWEPDVSLLPRSTLPTGADGMGGAHAQPELKLIATWPLGARGSLTANTAWVHGLATDAGGAAVRAGRVLTTAIATWSATARLTPFAEGMHLDATSRTEPAVSFVGVGATFLWTPDVQLDLRAAVGASPAAPRRQVSAGVGRRF